MVCNPYFWCCRCCGCRQRRDDFNDDDDESEDSEMYMIRRRGEERHKAKALQRQEFLINLLIQKVVVANKEENECDKDDDDKDDDQSDIVQIKELQTTNNTNCAICLMEYEPGTCIASSHNPKCQHFFHSQCIFEWLQNHDACPCCRNNYLILEDDENDDNETGDEQEEGWHRALSENNNNNNNNNNNLANTRPRHISSTQSTTPENDNDHSERQVHNHQQENSSSLLDRLYGTGVYHVDEPTFGRSMSSGNLGGLYDNQTEEPWETRLERTIERLRRQVESRVQVTRQQLRQHRDHGGSNNATTTAAGDSSNLHDGRVERSIELVRNQLERLRDAANREIHNRRNLTEVTATSIRDLQSRIRRDVRWDNAIQVVRTRLEDVANSEAAIRFRERRRTS